jgi:competence protein ComEA
MPSFSRSQLVVYGALAVVLLLLGARWIRSSEQGAADGGEVAFAASEQDEDAGEGSGFDVDAGGEDAVVHVAGEVRSPGVYRLPEGSRVADAIERAGGVTSDGAEDAINLAAEVADGQQVVVPAAVKGPSGAAVATAPGATDGPISLGTATLEQLETIDGIGPVTAQSILDYRDENGGLSSVDELDQVSGIGPATMDALRGRLQP